MIGPVPATAESVLARLSRRRWMIVATVLVVVVAMLTTSLLGDDVSAPTDSSGRSLRIDGPSTIGAGDPWRLDVGGLDLASGTVTIHVWGPWGVRSLDAAVSGDSAEIEIPADLTKDAGRLSALLRSGSATGRAGVDVIPGRAVDGIVPLAGPRSMIADGAHWSMVTAIPRDRYGNAVADGTAVELFVRRPDGAIDVVNTDVFHLLAGVRVFSGTTAGRSTIRVGVDGATGDEVDVLEVPGPPIAVELLEPTTTLRADGRMLVSLVTAGLADRFGNPLLDGTAASLTISGPGGRGRATGVTIDGRVEFVIEAPAVAGVLTLRAVVDGVASPSLELDFPAAVREFPLSVTRKGTGVESPVVVEVGPVLTELGGFAPDGTSVEVTAGSGQRSSTVVSELRDGSASIVVDARTGDALVVELLGTRTRLVAP